MDTSKEYIEMCKTDEIQELCNHDVGDFLWLMVGNGEVHVLSSKAVKAGRKAQCGVFIPRQIDIDSICVKHRDNAENIMSTVFDEINFDLYSRWCYVWLPRQDQLQDMLDDIFSNREIVPLTAKLHDVCMHLIQKHNFSGRTMEQLWLAFIVHEKYSMEWTGKEWIKC